MTKTRLLVAVLSLMVLAASRISAQKHYAVTSDRAIVVTREVLGNQGFEIVRVETHDHDRVVFYRRGNMGQGKGQGKLEKMVVRRVDNRIVFVDTPPVFMAQIDIRLRM